MTIYLTSRNDNFCFILSSP